MSFMVGALQSPGNFSPGGSRADLANHFPYKCIACQAIGYHRHVFWDCKAVKEKMKPIVGDQPKPKDALQKRYGLPWGTRDSYELDLAVINWISVVAEEILNQRYHKAENKEKMVLRS